MHSIKDIIVHLYAELGIFQVRQLCIGKCFSQRFFVGNQLDGFSIIIEMYGFRTLRVDNTAGNGAQRQDARQKKRTSLCCVFFVHVASLLVVSEDARYHRMVSPFRMVEIRKW